MIERSTSNAPHALLACLVSMCCGIGGCSDASLYGRGADNPAANRLAVKGRVCTDDPKDRGFPVKVLFLVDTAAGPMFSTYDPENIRLQALRETLALHGGNASFSFAVVGFDSRGRKLAPEEGYFTRNPGELENAIAMLSMPQPCVSEICRDYQTGLTLTRSIIEGDLTALTPGERSRTQYAVVMMTGDAPNPLDCASDCCDCADDDCDCGTCAPSMACTHQLLREDVRELRRIIEAQGAASFSFHTIFLSDANDTATINMLQEVSSAGYGRFERFPSADAITLDRLGLTRISSLFQIKSLMVTNENTLPNAERPIIDSDGDGIGDDQEIEEGTNPLRRDSDGDGVGDLVERLVSMDPTTADEEIPICKALEKPYGDADGDRLNDCEEMLLGSEPTLPDTDGDGILDWIEVKLGTNYLLPDTLDDPDGDGASNWEECKQHSDPRSSDAASHLGEAYRYRMDDPVFVNEPVISAPRRVEGVTILSAGPDTTGGLGTLRFLDGHRLSWQDPQDDAPAKPVKIDGPGEYILHSKPSDPDKPERWISVAVAPQLLPPNPQQELLLVEIAEKHCVTFTVSNIRLVETLQPKDVGGRNDIFIYFSQAPKGRLTLPGLFRVVHIPVTYFEGKGRIPANVTLEIRDEEFASIGF